VAADGLAPRQVELDPGETREIVFVLGYAENPKDAKFDPPTSQTINKRTVKPIIARYVQSVVVAKAFDDLRDYWTRCLNRPGRDRQRARDRMVNIWNAYQCMVTFNLSRSASGFESGIGRGMGFRDSNQDLLGFVHMVPTRPASESSTSPPRSCPTGGAYHQYQPLTKRA